MSSPSSHSPSFFDPESSKRPPVLEELIETPPLNFGLSQQMLWYGVHSLINETSDLLLLKKLSSTFLESYLFLSASTEELMNAVADDIELTIVSSTDDFDLLEDLLSAD